MNLLNKAIGPFFIVGVQYHLFSLRSLHKWTPYLTLPMFTCHHMLLEVYQPKENLYGS